MILDTRSGMGLWQTDGTSPIPKPRARGGQAAAMRGLWNEGAWDERAVTISHTVHL